ncbi:MAG TPA: acyl-CoA dehydrogenase family protein [Mycobacterium sp.]|nr:acyl-CoA dehydrogenase family protein [Mycobacterium sp.]
MSDELKQLVDDLGRRSLEKRLGHRRLPEVLDDALWTNLEATGLSRLTAAQGAGPVEAAIVLTGLARHCAAVPIAETDLLAAWLADAAGLTVPGTGPLTVALADAEERDGRITGTARDVPWPEATVVLAARTADRLRLTVVDDPRIAEGHNLAGEPRGSFSFDMAAEDFLTVESSMADELSRRGAWARCQQMIGALDAARDLTVAHTGERVQFGQPLRKFQAVQHSLAAIAGEIERARAAATLAVAAAFNYGFNHATTDYAVTVAKVAVGRAVGPVTTIAHQLHGAIGVTIEHRLWLATMRARSWVGEFGTTGHYARRLGRMALAADDPWDIVVSCPAPR